MPETHTGLHIAQRKDQIRNEFGIAKENVAGITRDNAANMDVAMAELGFPDFLRPPASRESWLSMQL